MNWELSDEQQLYATSLRDWLASRADPRRVRNWLEAGDQHTFDTALLEDGWAGVGFDEAIGGQGGGLLELALTARELGRSCAPSARWLARAVSAGALTAEPELARAALDGVGLTTFAGRSDRIPSSRAGVRLLGGRVSGAVPCVLAAAESDHFLVPAVTPEGGTRLAVVERHADGVDVRSRPLLDRSRAVADVLFDSATARLIDTADRDPDAVLSGLANRAAVLVAADALGAAERMLDMTVDYAKQRKQFGRAIAAFQAVKHTCAQMLVTIEAGYSVALFAAASVDAGAPEADLHAAAAKAQVGGRCAELADDALTVHGAIGYTWEYDLQLFYKRAKLDRVLFGAPAACNERIAALLPILPAAS